MIRNVTGVTAILLFALVNIIIFPTKVRVRDSNKKRKFYYFI